VSKMYFHICFVVVSLSGFPLGPGGDGWHQLLLPMLVILFHSRSGPSQDVTVVVLVSKPVAIHPEEYLGRVCHCILFGCLAIVLSVYRDGV